MGLFRRAVSDDDLARLADLLSQKQKANREPLWARGLGWGGERLIALVQDHLLPRVPRSSWAVAGGGLGLLVGSVELHQFAPAAWPAAVVAGAGVAGAAVWRLAGRLRWVVGVTAGAVGTWLAAAWALGLARPLLVIALLGTVTGAAFLTGRGARSRPKRAGREPNPAEIVAHWAEIAKAARVPSEHAKIVAKDATGFTLLGYLQPGHVTPEAVARLDPLESALDQYDVRAGSLTISRDPEHASWCYVRVVVRDPLAKVLPWKGPTTSLIVGTSLDLGLFADGKDVQLRMLAQAGEGVNLLVAGIKGSGKSGVLHVIIGDLAHCRDVVLWGIDLKRLEFPKWRSCFDRLALEPHEADELLDAAWRVLQARSRELARLGVRAWEPSPDMPLLVLVVDELAELSDSMAKLDRLARLGRALGIQLVLATQRPSAQALGDKGTELRSQVDAVIAMRVGRPEEGNVVLGQGRLSEGWRPDRLKAKGEFLIASPEDDHDRPRRARAFRVTDRDIERWARECADLRPHLDDASARAAEGLS